MFIQKLGLKNFKCFKEVDVDFSKITLLTGENSSGKSSFLYGLLAPLQSIHMTGESFPLHLALNGEYVNMGGFEDSSFNHNLKNQIAINLTISKNVDSPSIFFDTSWFFDLINKSPRLRHSRVTRKNIDQRIFLMSVSMSENQLYILEMNKELYVDKIHEQTFIDQTPEKITTFFWNCGITSYEDSDLIDINTFNFISSFRFQPDRTYYQSSTNNKVDKFGNGYIDQILKWSDTQSKELTRLVSILKELGMVYDIKPHRLSGGRFEIKVKVKKQSKWESLADVGFGTSQFMPIIVADLQLSDESTLIMCQPEIHLHPSIQANLGDYLVKQVNEKKKQYIVETHSEYLLNRIRLLIVKGEIEPEDVAVYYFENSVKEGSVTHRIEFTKDGQILNAPRGFFETYMIDTMDIALNA
jgi:predicted ATPase